MKNTIINKIAAGQGGGGGGYLEDLQNTATPNFKSTDTLGTVVGKTMPYIFFFAGLTLLIYFTFAGFNLMNSGGDPQKIKAAQAKMTTAIFGFIIIFSAFWVVQFAGLFLGLDAFNSVFGQ